MIEYITDKMYEFITAKGSESIEQLKEQYNNQFILYGIIKRFGKGDYFKQEYRNLTYIEQKDMILQLSADKLLPTLSVKEICKNIHDVFLHIFIGDGDIGEIEKIIVTEYLSKRKLTIRLIDLAIIEKESTDKIYEQVDEVKRVVEKINYVNEHKGHRKNQILKYGLGRKIDLFISEAVKHYLCWVNKGNVTHLGNEIPVIIQYFQQIRDLIDCDFPNISEEFYMQPIEILVTNQIPVMTKEVSPIDYMLYVRTNMEIKSEGLLRMSDYLPDEFIYTMMEYIDMFAKNSMYDSASRTFMNMSINARPSIGTDRRKEIIHEVRAFGNIILKFESMYNAYLK